MEQCVGKKWMIRYFLWVVSIYLNPTQTLNMRHRYKYGHSNKHFLTTTLKRNSIRIYCDIIIDGWTIHRNKMQSSNIPSENFAKKIDSNYLCIIWFFVMFMITHVMAQLIHNIWVHVLYLILIFIIIYLHILCKRLYFSSYFEYQ